MNKKAQQFHNFIKEHRIENSFSISEHTEWQRNFVLFDTSVEVNKGNYLKLVVILEEGLQTIIRLWLSKGPIKDQDKTNLFYKLNELNSNYKSFKFFLDERDNLIMDWINSTPDELFDSNLIHFMLGIIHREVKTICEYLGDRGSISLTRENHA